MEATISSASWWISIKPRKRLARAAYLFGAHLYFIRFPRTFHAADIGSILSDPQIFRISFWLGKRFEWEQKMANPDACLLKSREAHNGRWNTCAGDVRTDSLLSVLGVRHSFGRTSVYTKKRVTTNVTPATIYSSTWRKCVYMHDNVDRTMIYLACIMHPSMIYRTLRHSTDKFSQRHATLARQKTDQLLLLQLVLIHAYQTLQSFHLIFKTTSNLR